MKRFFAFITAVLMLFSLASCGEEEEKGLKYIFLFIGDGMGLNAVTLTEKVAGEVPFTDFEGMGLVSTYDTTSLIPDSASSGTAIATGEKTYSSAIAVNDNGKKLQSIATVLKREHNMKVGIITTANLNHATPGVFYAHSKSRYNYYEIGSALAESGFDLFIGGEFLDADGGDVNLVDMAVNGGYTLLDSQKEIKAKKKASEKYLIIDPHTDSSGMMSFAIERERGAMSLADYVALSIDTLDNENGFFIMCEGGRIDTALHANDAATAVGEVSAFGDAVEEAVKFYKKHPDETLIIVTADHETSGLALGYGGTGYTTDLDALKAQRISYLTYQKDYAEEYVKKDATLHEILLDIELLFGVEERSLTDSERSALERAYEKSIFGTDTYTEEDYILYSNRNPLSAAVMHLVAHRAGVDFSSFVHTAAEVGIWATGVGAEEFSGSMDNTEISRKIYSLLGISH